MNDIKPKKRPGLKILVGIGVLAGMFYLGKALNAGKKFDEGLYKAREVIEDVVTEDVGEIATHLYGKVQQTENINVYANELQEMMYSVTEKFNPANQVETIDGMIQRTEQSVQQELVTRTYERQPVEFKSVFTQQHIDDVPYDERVEIAKDIMRDIYEKNKNDFIENLEEMKDRFSDLYNKFRDRVDNPMLFQNAQ